MMEQENTPNKSFNRREFLKRFHAAATVTYASTWVGCTFGQKNAEVQTSSSQSKKKGEMTYRITPNTGDNVSLLGYGCLRWANVLDKETGAIDQEGVNRLVDYAIEHGVNYFDTAPVYCNGECERVTGMALSRHPRVKYYIAAKISNLELETWSREETLKMYYNSFKELQVDYIDYMMLHGVGMDFLDSTAQKFVRYPLIPCNDCKI